MGMFIAIAVGFAIGGALLALFRWGRNYLRRRSSQPRSGYKMGWVAKSLIGLLLIGAVAYAVEDIRSSRGYWLYRVGKAIYERDGDTFIKVALSKYHPESLTVHVFGGCYLLRFIQPDKYGKLNRSLVKCWSLDSLAPFDIYLDRASYGHPNWSAREDSDKYIPCGYDMRGYPERKTNEEFKEAVRKIINDPKRLNIPSPWWLLREVECGVPRKNLWGIGGFGHKRPVVDCKLPLPDGSEIKFTLRGKRSPTLRSVDVIDLWNHFDSKFHRLTTQVESKKKGRWVEFDGKNKLKEKRFRKRNEWMLHVRYYWAKCPCKKPKPFKVSSKR
jgi:hypothetical protein